MRQHFQFQLVNKHDNQRNEASRLAQSRWQATQRFELAQRLGVARASTGKIGRCGGRVEVAPRARAFNALGALDDNGDIRRLRKTKSRLRGLPVDRDVRSDANFREIGPP